MVKTQIEGHEKLKRETEERPFEMGLPEEEEEERGGYTNQQARAVSHAYADKHAFYFTKLSADMSCF